MQTTTQTKHELGQEEASEAADRKQDFISTYVAKHIYRFTNNQMSITVQDAIETAPESLLAALNDSLAAMALKGECKGVQRALDDIIDSQLTAMAEVEYEQI